MSLGAPGSLAPGLTDHEDLGKGLETQEKGSLTSNSSREQKRAETCETW